MSGTGHELLLVVALAALGGAGLRAAAALGADGLVRLVAAAPIATALAVLEALGLGLLSVGSSPWLLTGSAVLTWGVVRAATGGLTDGRGQRRLDLAWGVGARLVDGAVAQRAPRDGGGGRAVGRRSAGGSSRTRRSGSTRPFTTSTTSPRGSTTAGRDRP